MGPKEPNRPLPTILDQFTSADFRSWNRLSELSEEYHLKLFYHLEGQRAFHHKDLCRALTSSKTLCLGETGWWRIVDFLYANEPLASKGSLAKGGRFNIGNDLSSFKPFPALYVAETEKAAYAEKFGVLETEDGFKGHELALREVSSYAAVRLKFELHNVFDLSDASKLAKFTKIISKFKLTKELKLLATELGISGPLLISKPTQLKENLLGEWRNYPIQFEVPANTQLFGRILKDAGFEAVIYPSTKLKGEKCIAIFTENLSNSESYVELIDAAAGSVTHTKLNADNWKELSTL